MNPTLQEAIAAVLALATLAAIVLLTVTGSEVDASVIAAFTLATGYLLGSRTSTPGG